MNYHNITKCDMLNGEGLRVVLWVAGCDHHCPGCQNPQTWDCSRGIPFNQSAENEILDELNRDYIEGITFSGGDPLNDRNLETVWNLIQTVKQQYPEKNIWLYTGYTYEQIAERRDINNNISLNNLTWLRKTIVKNVNVLVDGRYVAAERDVSLRWKGSKNQRVIDVKKTINEDTVKLWCPEY